MKPILKMAILILVAIGLIVFGRMLSNGFVGDDYELIVNNPKIQNVFNIPSLFTQGLFYDETGLRNNFYRPIEAAAFAIIYLFSGQNPFGYHLFQILMHIGDAVLIFLIFRYFFRSKLSFILALIFLVHPINGEAVFNISALEENLFMFLGLTALYISMKKSVSLMADFIVFLLLLSSLLSKETAIVFLIIIPVFKFLYQRKNLLKSIYQSIGAFLTYLFLRLAIAHINFNGGELKMVPIQTMNFYDRIVNIPKIIFFYLKTFFYPKDLISFQSWVIKSVNYENFYLPLIFDSAFLITVIMFGLILYKKNRDVFKGYLFFAVWFFAGLSMHLQIIPLDQTVADRWFYFPAVGILGMILIGIKYLDSSNIIKFKILLPLIIAAVFLMAFRTLVRAGDWKDNATLVTHDSKLSRDNFQIEGGLGDIASSKGDIIGAEAHYTRATKLFPGDKTFGTLGDFYLKNGMFDKSITAYNEELSYNKIYAVTWSYLAMAKYLSGDKKGALEAAQRAYELSPTETFSNELYAIENNLPITLE